MGGNQRLLMGHPYDIPGRALEHAVLRATGFEEIPLKELSPGLLCVIEDEARRGLDPSLVW